MDQGDRACSGRGRNSGNQKGNSVYTRLVDAGQMLMDVIARNQGGANQDLTRFTEQILALAKNGNR